MLAYQLGDLTAVAEAALCTLATGPSGASETSSSTFLHADSTLTCTLVTSGGSFLFWMAAATPPMKLAEHFPQMLPFSPWGLVDTEPFPFPHPAGVEVTNTQWDYIYLCAEGATDAARRRLTTSLDAELFSQLDPDVQDFAKADGGLYYRGKVALASDKLLSASSQLASFIPTELAVDVAGYLTYRGGLLPMLTLQVPLLEINGSDLGFGNVQRISLALEIAASLAGPDALAKAGSRRVGVVGTLVVDDANKLTMTGSWPLDDDDVQLSFTCKTKQFKQWFVDTPLADLPWPSASVDATVALVVSKQSGKLEKAGLAFETTDWVIGPENFLTLNEVKLAVTVFSPAALCLTTASFRANATIGTTQLRCEGNYPGGDYYLGLAEGSTVSLNGLIKSMGGGELGFSENLAITALSGRYNASSGYRAFTLAIGTTDEAPNLNAGELGFHLENISLGIYGSSDLVFKLSAAFRYKFTEFQNKEIRFWGSAEFDGDWVFSLNYTGNVSLLDIGTEFKLRNLPKELKAFTFDELSFVADNRADSKYFHGKGTIDFEGVDTALELRVNRVKTNATFSTTFSGSLRTKLGGSDVWLLIDSISGGSSELDVRLHLAIAGVTVELEAQTGSSGDGSLGKMHFMGSLLLATPLHISELLADLLAYGGVELPDGFIPDLNLDGLYVSYDGNARQLDLIALSTIAGEEVRFFFQYQFGENGRYALGIETTVDELSGIPLIGSELKEVKLSDIGFVYLSKEGAVVLPALSKASGEGQTRTIDLSGAEQSDYVKGFNLTGNIKLPLMEKPLALRLPVAKGTPADAASNNAASLRATTTSTEVAKSVPAVPATAAQALVAAKSQPLASDGKEKWFELDAKIGPLHISQVGLSYAEGKLYLLISLDLTLAGLVFSADGLGLGFTPQKLLKGELETPAFKLAGLGLSYNSGPVQISGAFLHGKQPVMGEDGTPEKDETGSDIMVDAYSGGAIVKLENFTITGVGSYATYKSEPSLFVYALYEGALGGPSFFFVTGLSIGFGYNRKVNVPAFDHVAQFPLVKMAMDSEGNKHKTIASLLHDLETVDPATGKLPIDIAMGEYWLAVGVKFTSFEIVHGYLLLIAEFGHHLQFSVLGVAELSLPLPPPGATISDDMKLVYLKMQMAAVLIPSEGFFSVAGSLTPDSYVLTKDCHITGGFAYSMWYDSPDAEKNGKFVMTAGGFHPAFNAPSYFPQVPRLGYIWQVSDVVSIKGQSYYALTSSCGMAGTSLEVLFESGDIKAWFIAKADMLVTWHPLSFVAEVYVELGVAVRLNLLFCHKTVSVSISAGLTLWGPPLGGRVEVHVVIVTLTIGFGSDSADNKNLVPLPWQSISGADSFKSLLPASNDVCKILAGSGVTQPKPTSDIWVVRGGTFSFTAQSAIPISKLTSNVPSCNLGDLVNIRPMNASGVKSTYELTITKHGASTSEIIYWTIEPVYNNVAAALWGVPLTEGDDKHFVQAPAVPSNDVVNQLIGCQVKAPAPESGDSFGIVELTELAFVRVADGGLAFDPAALPPNYRLADYKPLASASAPSSVATTPAIVAKSPTKRGKLFKALMDKGLFSGSNDDLPQLTADYTMLFKNAPLLYPAPAA